MKHKTQSMKSKRGFTLIELLIYISILGVILIVIAGFFWNIALGYTKESSYQELQHNGRFIFTKMDQEIKKAKNIIQPLQGSSSDSLILEMPDSSQVNFRLDNGRLIIEREGIISQLTTSQVFIDSLQFTNMSYSEDSELVKVDIALSRVNPDNISAYRSNINLTTSVALYND